MRVALILALSSLGFSAEYDLLILNARVIDGSGNPWFHADIGIRNGKIAALGSLSKSSAERMIDAGRQVATLDSSMSTLISKVALKKCRAGIITSLTE
jgi:N-acyl-D-amino-acid deacylase